jgi:arylsulfatase A-like enzyme
LFAALACEGEREDASDPGTSREDAPPNVVLIVVDTLRADHLSHYGYTRPTSAALDAFRADSTLYSRAYSTAPWTGPSTISIHTGLSPLRHGANAHGPGRAEVPQRGLLVSSLDIGGVENPA